MLRGRLGRRFCEKKPKPPYVFRHPSQGNRRGDARPASKNRRNHSAVESSREKTEGEGAIPLRVGVFQPEGFQAVWFPSVGRNWAVRQYRFLLRGSRWSAQEEVVPGGIGTQRAPPSRRFGATDYKAALNSIRDGQEPPKPARG